MKKQPQSARPRTSGGRTGSVHFVAPLRIKRRWSGYMVIDGTREWQLPLSRDLARQVVARNARDAPQEERNRLVQDLVSEDWADQYELQA